MARQGRPVSLLCAAAAFGLAGADASAQSFGEPNFVADPRGEFVDLFFVNIPSFGKPGDEQNYVEIVDLNELYGLDPASNAWEIVALGWNVTIFTEYPSFLAEARIFLDDADDLDDPTHVRFLPGVGSTDTGLGHFLSDGLLRFDEAGPGGAGIPPLNLDRGLLRLEFNESSDDFFFEDAYWDGRITLEVRMIPAPGGLTLLGVAGFAGVRRRRSA